MLAKGRSLDRRIFNRKREHGQARVHDLAADAILVLLGKPLRRVDHSRIQPVVASGDLCVCLRCSQRVPSDTKTADSHPALPGDVEELALAWFHLDCWRTFTETFGQSVKHGPAFNNMRIAGIELHDASPLTS